MDKFNIPSDDNNINGVGDWETVPDDISDTAELPIIDQANDDKDTDESDPVAREDDSSVFDSNKNVDGNNATEAVERKPHKLRNAVIGAVAIVAVASGVALFNGNNNSQAVSVPGNTSADSAITTTNQEQVAEPEAYETPEATDTQSDAIEEGASFLEVIAEERRDGDGVLLTMDELVYGAKVNSPAELTEYPDTTCSLLSEWVEYNRDDLAVTQCEVIEDFGGDVPIVRADFPMYGDRGYGNVAVYIKPHSNYFTIQLSYSSEYETYEYESTDVPDVQNLRQLIESNL